MYLDGHAAIQGAVKETAEAGRRNGAEPPKALENLVETVVTDLQRIACALEEISINTRRGA